MSGAEPGGGFKGLTRAEMLHVDAVCERYEQLLRDGTTPPVEEHLADLAEPVRGVLEVELLKLRHHYRGERFVTAGEIGSGGMGEVFLAHDTQLGREVALKRLLVHLVDRPGARDRFLREAKLTASLDHPGIVPIYAVGRSEDGRPFYAMRLIEGEPLTKTIARFHEANPDYRSVAFRRLLGHFIDACRAIAHAHGRKVVHRDLKPSNVVVGQRGQTVVVDWGLAKKLDEAAETPTDGSDADSDDAGLSHTGEALGTPGYLSPEQVLDAKSAGTASDVFGLGATLYHLLTNRPPFDGPRAIIREKILQGEFPRPRSLVAAIPSPLEAVCLKAMALGLDDRYATADALAEDVERWMADAPVSTYRDARPVRFARWVRRHPRIVSGLAVGVSTGLFAVSALVAQREWSRRTMESTNVELVKQTDAAVRSRESAERRFKLAIVGADGYRKAIEENQDMRGRSELQELRARLLGYAREFNRWLIADLRSDPSPTGESSVLMASAYIKFASIQVESGKSEEVESSCNEALRLLTGASATCENTDILRGKTYSALGKSRVLQGKHQEGLSDFDKAIESFRIAQVRSPLGEEERDMLAGTLDLRAIALSRLARPEEGLSSLEKAIALQESLVKDIPGKAKHGQSLSHSYSMRAIVHREAKRFDLAIADHERACRLGRALVDKFPYAGLRIHQSVVLIDFGVTLKNAERMREALERYGEARKLLAALIVQIPEEVGVRLSLAALHQNVGIVWRELGRIDEAVASFERAIDEWREIEARTNGASTIRINRTKSHLSLAKALREAGQVDKACASLREGLALGETVLGENRDNFEVRSQVAVMSTELGQLLAPHSPAEAARCFKRGEELQRGLIRDRSTSAIYREGLAETLGASAVSLLRLGRSSEALQQLQEALNQLEAIPLQPTASRLIQRGTLYFELGKTLAALNRDGEARIAFRASLKDAGDALRLAPGVDSIHRSLREQAVAIAVDLAHRRMLKEAADVLAGFADTASGHPDTLFQAAEALSAAVRDGRVPSAWGVENVKLLRERALRSASALKSILIGAAPYCFRNDPRRAELK